MTPQQVKRFKKLYFKDKLSTRQVAKRIGVHDSTIRKYAKQHKVKLRSKSESIRLRESSFKHGLSKDSSAYKKFQRYKITPKDYDSMLDEQDNKCKICGEEFVETPQIDHCHETNTVRGLLCRTCNTGLGFFKDSVHLLADALKYLSDFMVKK